MSQTDRALGADVADDALTDIDGSDQDLDDTGERLLGRIDQYVDNGLDARGGSNGVRTVNESEVVTETVPTSEPAAISESELVTEAVPVVAEPAAGDHESGDGDDESELPEIVMATESESGSEAVADVSTPVDRFADPDPASDDVLEELRRADVDGPIVHMAPQDNMTAGRRRPKRSPEYDPAPVPIPAAVPRILGRKPRVRRVTRVVRHVDPWSVFKIAVVANLVLYAITMTAGVLLWNVAYATGTIDNIERFFESFGWTSFEFSGGDIYNSAWIGGLFVVLGFTGLAVLAATLFNLITDLVGGMRFTVLEEEVVETRTSPMRRFVVRRAEPEVPAISHDASGPIIREAIVDDSGSIPR